MQQENSELSLLVSLDDYRAAKIVLDQFGEDAERQALRHIDCLFETGDHDGVSRWISVVAAIRELRLAGSESIICH